MHQTPSIVRVTLISILLFIYGCTGPGTGYRSRSVPPLQSDDPYAHLQMAQKYLFMFFDEKSYYHENINIVIRESNEALKLNPQIAEAYYFLGYGMAFKGILIEDEVMIQKGLSQFRDSIERKPSLGNSGQLLPLPFMLAKFYLETDEKTKAVPYLRETIKLNPDLADSHFLLGSVYSSEEKYELALHEYRTAIDISPENAEVAKYLALTYGLVVDAAAKKKSSTVYDSIVNKAIIAAKNAVRLNPDDIMVHEVLGILYGSAGLFDLKIFELQTVLKEDSSTIIYYELGTAYQGKNLLKKAEKNFIKALEIDPNHGTARLCLAYCYYLMNDYVKACDVFKEYFKSTKSPSVYCALWYYNSKIATGNASKANAFLSKYSRSFKGDIWEKCLLDYHLGKHGDAELISMASQRFDKCEAFFFIGCRHYHKGNLKLAKEYFLKVLQTKIYDYYEYSAANARLIQLKEKAL